MTLDDFISKNNLEDKLTFNNGKTVTIESDNLVVDGQILKKIEVKCNRDSCIMEVRLYGTNLESFGEELSKGSFTGQFMGFRYITQSRCADEIVIYSIEPDSHVYDAPYHTGRSWEELMGF